MFETILIAYDGSDHAKAALKTACGLAKATGATLHGIVVPQAVGDTLVVGTAVVSIPPTAAALAEAGAAMKDEAAALARGHGSDIADVHLASGDPGHAIVDQANALNCALIVMGRRGLGQLSGMLLGSTANKVNHLADCAVMTVK